MKKLFAFLLAVATLSVLSLNAVSAASSKKIDCRELEEYGQPHYYLGAPIANKPDVEDATVSENEYAVSYQFKKGDKVVVIENGTETCNTEWAKVYMAYDEQNIYLAMQVKDTDYVKGKDGVSFNMSFKDRGNGYDVITRMCFDIYQHAEAEEDDISTFTTRCRFLIKNDKGEWDSPPSVEGMEYITDISGKYDESTQIFTVELEIYLKPLLRFWNNELDLKDVRLLLVPFVWMYGSATEESGEPVNQGIMWNYLPMTNSSLKAKFLSDYSYSPPWLTNIVHFCEDPKYTTEAPPTTTVEQTEAVTTDAPTAAGNTTATPTTAAITDEPNAPNDMAKGCGAAIVTASVAPLAALAAVVITAKKRKDD